MATTATEERSTPEITQSAGRGGVVPYIVTWSEEKELPIKLVERAGIGLGFADETTVDRDRDGILWNRISMQPGRGRPRFAVVHFMRQRRAMRRLLCQICAQPADSNEQGTLWLLPDRRDEWQDWPEGLDLAEPPICAPCARVAARLCPHLREGWVAVRARYAPLSGVKGFIYRPGCPSPILVRDELVTYENHATLRWTLAEQQLRTLHDCTLVSVGDSDRRRSGS